MKRKLLWLILIVVVVYIASYVCFRATHVEVWEKNGKLYVIFPKDYVVVYYLFRPLTYLDGALTGMGFHIGQHQ